MSKRILIVEDEESIADLEKDYLELSGFEVEVANDGETGLRRGLAVEFDLPSDPGAEKYSNYYGFSEER